MESLEPDEQRAKVEERIRGLFSGAATSLGKLQESANSAVDMQGIESFHTPLPWRLELTGVQSFIGESENLNNTIKDIVSQLRMLLKTFPERTEAKLHIDSNRLLKLSAENTEVA